MATDEAVLQYLYNEGKARQKRDIALALDTTPKFIEAIMTKLRRKGLVKVSTHRGWWSLTEKGTIYMEGGDIKEPFFDSAQVNASPILRILSAPDELNKASAKRVPDELLEFYIAIYLIKHDLPYPVGKNKDMDDDERELFGQLAAHVSESIDSYSRREINSEVNK